MLFPFLIGLLLAASVTANDGLPPKRAEYSQVFILQKQRALADSLTTTLPQQAGFSMELELEAPEDYEARALVGYELGSRRRARLQNRSASLKGREGSLRQRMLETEALCRLRSLWVDLYTAQFELKAARKLFQQISGIVDKTNQQVRHGLKAATDARRLNIKKSLLLTRMEKLEEKKVLALLEYSLESGRGLPADLELTLPGSDLRLGDWGGVTALPDLEAEILSLQIMGNDIKNSLLRFEYGASPVLSAGLRKEQGADAEPVLMFEFNRANPRASRQHAESIKISNQALILETEQLKHRRSLMETTLQGLYEKTYHHTQTIVIPAEKEAAQTAVETRNLWVEGQINLTDWLDTLELWEESIVILAEEMNRTLKLEIQLVAWRGKP